MNVPLQLQTVSCSLTFQKHHGGHYRFKVDFETKNHTEKGH